MKFKLAAATFSLALTMNTAFAYHSYDPRTGNSYNVTENYGGGARVDGYNSSTGSTWHTTIENNGNMRGTDSDYNSWTYNSSTGAYYNYGTGESCYGKGSFRTCN